MASYQIQMPDGKKYKVDGPEGYTQEQAYKDLQGHLGSQGETGGVNTRGGDLLRGLVHGAEGSLGGEAPPDDMSGWRNTGETIGGVIPSVAIGLAAPEALGAKALFGVGSGALQPAKDWKERATNAAIGGGSALIGSGVGSYIAKHRSALNQLANEAIGSVAGASHLGPWGGLGGLYAGRNVGHLLQNLTSGRGLADLLAGAARNPGLAAYLGIKASPYASEAGQFVGQELGKPSE